MRTVSTGVGLCVLSGTIAACFAMSHFGGEVRAFAQLPSTQSPRFIQNTDQEPATYRQQFDTANAEFTTTSCQTNSVTWLDNTPHVIPVCEEIKAVGVPPLYAADVNGDSQMESFALNYNTIATALANGQQTGEAVRIARAVKTQDSIGTSTYQSELVFDSNNALASLRQQYPWATTIQFSASLGRGGWLDMDNDEDLDLVLWISLAGNSNQSIEGTLWFENTGYQAPPPPNPYDLDQDGEVGAGDISVLLLNFD